MNFMNEEVINWYYEEETLGYLVVDVYYFIVSLE